MAFFTKINNFLIKRIRKLYSIEKINNISGISEGTENSNYEITLNNRKYILTIIEKIKKIKKIIKKKKLLEYILNKNIPVPKILKCKKRNNLFLYKNKISLITSKINGISLIKVNKFQCFEIGKNISKIHKLAKFFGLKNEMDFIFINKFYNKKKKKIKKSDSFFIKKELIYLKSKLNKISLKNIPSGICHNDIFKDNVFFIKNKISGIIDFYFSSNNYFLFDISVIILEWCHGIKLFKKKMKYFILGYLSERKIKNCEIKLIPFFLRYVSLRFFITRLINRIKYKKKFKSPYEYKKKNIFFKKNSKKIISYFYKIKKNEKLHNKNNKKR
ncbi:homoserine kinase [Candidatus Vidania fulgoroideorum]